MSVFTGLTPDMSYTALRNLLDSQDRRQQEDLLRAEELYNNATEPSKGAGMSTTDMAYRVDAWTPAALTAVIVDKVASTLYSRPVRRSTGNAAWDAALESTFKGMMRLMLRVSKLASIGGNTCIRLGWEWPGRVVYSDTGLGQAVPILDPEMPHTKPVGIIFDYTTRTITEQIRAAIGKEMPGAVHICEVITRHQRDPKGNIVAPGIHLLFVDGHKVPLEDGGLNALGDYLGCVFWRGADHPTSAYGRSDIIPLMLTLDALNELLTTTHEKVIWSIHSPVVTNIRGKLEFRLGPREVWQIAGGGAAGQGEFIKRLEADHDINSPISFIKLLVQLVHETSRIPSVAVGDLEGIGAVGSGRAYEIALQPLEELTREKEMCAVEQELELMAETVAMMAYWGALPGLGQATEAGWMEPNMLAISGQLLSATIEFAPLVYPRDEMAVASIRANLAASSLESKRVAIETLHPEWTVDQVETELAALQEVADVENASAQAAFEELQKNINSKEQATVGEPEEEPEAE